MADAKDDARTRILNAALLLVGRGGGDALSNRAIAREAGVSLGTLTYHFADQRSLLREALDAFLAEEIVRLEALAAAVASQELTGAQGAAALETMLSTELDRRAAKLELYLRAARDPELRDAARRCFAAYDQLASSASASLGIANPGELAPILVAVIDGLQLRRLATGDDSTLAPALELLLGRLGAS